MLVRDLEVGEEFVMNGVTWIKVAPKFGERLVLQVEDETAEAVYDVDSEDSAAVAIDGPNIGQLLFLKHQKVQAKL